MSVDLKDKVFLLAPKGKGLIGRSYGVSSTPLDLSGYDKIETSFDIACEWLFNARVLDSKVTHKMKYTYMPEEYKSESHGPNCIQEHYTESGYVAVDFPYINQAISSNNPDSEFYLAVAQGDFVDREASITSSVPEFLIEDDSVYCLGIKALGEQPWYFETSLSKTEYKVVQHMIPGPLDFQLEYSTITWVSKITDTYF